MQAECVSSNRGSPYRNKFKKAELNILSYYFMLTYYLCYLAITFRLTIMSYFTQTITNNLLTAGNGK